MNLFENKEIIQVLPYDGMVKYHGKMMGMQESQHYLERLLQTIEWRNDEVIIFGKQIITKRKVAWYGDAGRLYTYSHTTKLALPWTKELLELKTLAEKLTGSTFNSCLLNLYHSGEEGMSWHSDDEKELETNGAIASISFGAERKFVFKHKKTSQQVSLLLENGSLLVMEGATQIHWLHSLPKSAKIKAPRINLTFRRLRDKEDKKIKEVTFG
jgi:alkylated DNA repair dioxygenase AlkB